MTWVACAGRAARRDRGTRLAAAVLVGLAFAGPAPAQSGDSGEPPPMPRRHPVTPAETLLLLRGDTTEPAPASDSCDDVIWPARRSPAETMLILRAWPRECPTDPAGLETRPSREALIQPRVPRPLRSLGSAAEVFRRRRPVLPPPDLQPVDPVEPPPVPPARVARPADGFTQHARRESAAPLVRLEFLAGTGLTATPAVPSSQGPELVAPDAIEVDHERPSVKRTAVPHASAYQGSIRTMLCAAISCAMP